MPRLTDYDKLVSKHYAELSAALESIRWQLKPAYMWQLTAENCHQIYSRLCGLNIAPFSSRTSGDTGNLTVIELHPRHKDEGSEWCTIAFFGSIPQIVSNINSLLQTGAPNEKNNKVFEAKEEGGNSFFIDVSPSSTLPRIMQDEEEAVLARKCLLLHMRDYLQANIGAKTLNANDCLSTLPSSCTDNHDPWDLCFISGVFLAYPLIYCNSKPQEGNCLAHQALTNYTVTLDDHEDFPMYSFSVPERFHAQTSRRVKDWFEGLCEKASAVSQRLRLHQTVETHALILT